MITLYVIVTGLLFLLSCVISWQDDEPVTLVAHSLIFAWAAWLMMVEL